MRKHSKNDFEDLKCFLDKSWRLRNLYYIKDTQGKRIKFIPNWAQEALLADPHPCKIVLKARQLGLTTISILNYLDDVLFENNISAGVIAHTLVDAQNIFTDKLKFAFENMDVRVRSLFSTVGDSAKELSFKHGSYIRVGTSLRSSTLQRLHISEFGKICAKDPEKAREIITGSLNTVHSGQQIIIESTAEGKEGHFYKMCQRAMQQTGELSPLDFKFFFFPWWKHPDYVLQVYQEVPDDLKEYFVSLHNKGIILNDMQKNWYVSKAVTQGDDMLREYPSTPEEAFAVSQVGYWYSQQIKEVYERGAVCRLAYDPQKPVHTAWDLGQADYSAIWFFQMNRQNEILLIDFWQAPDTPLHKIVAILQQKGYTYGTHIWPHDASQRDRSGSNFVQQAQLLGLAGLVLNPSGVADGINLVRTTLPRCWFDQSKCQAGINALENYKKRWNSSIGGYTGEPVHDESSHAADAFRYLCHGIDKVSDSGSLSSDYKALRSYWG